MDIEELSKLKQLLDDGVISEEEFEEQKKLIFKKSKKSKNLGLIIGIIVVFVICIAIIGGNDSDNEPREAPVNQSGTTETTDKTADKYSDPLPIGVSTSMYDNIINIPELKCTFTNNTNKEISAIKIYFEPVDVYGEKVDTIFTTNDMYTDTPIAAGATYSTAWQMIDSQIKGGDVFVYSVYFADGSEWGDKDASSSEIKKYAYKIETKY